jgi:glutamate-5-semialdehyde dehydrogenase
MNALQDLALTMASMGQRARAAAKRLASSSAAQRDGALRAMAAKLRAAVPEILAGNAQDLAALSGAHATPAFKDRLALNPERIEGIAKGLEDVAARPDPLHKTLDETTQPNGLKIARVSVPIGVIGIIYESRPNVTADAGALCVKSGNAAILRGGSEALNSSRAIHAALETGLAAAGLPHDAIQLVQSPDRAAVGHLLAGLDGAIDLIVPRGGKGLVKRVQDEARVAVLAHLDGNNHVYVDKEADPGMARAVVLNSKMRRVGVCGAAETVLVDQAAPHALKRDLILSLLDAGCAVRGDDAMQALDARVAPAVADDWTTEYLDAIIAAREVDGVVGAIEHIETYGSHHTDAIVTGDAAAAAKFLHEIDSAILLWNASTQFADGAEFGLGAEIGIGTGRLHARGPVGAEQLTIYKYVVRGDGHIRP